MLAKLAFVSGAFGFAACGSVGNSHDDAAVTDTGATDAWASSCTAPAVITNVETGSSSISGPCLHGSWYLQALNGTTTPTAPGQPDNTAQVVPTAIAVDSNPLDPGSSYAIHVSGANQMNTPNTFAYAQLTVSLNTLSASQIGTVDASAYTGLQFNGKMIVGASGVRLTIADLYTDPSGGMCSAAGGATGCFDSPGITLAVSADWKQYRVAFADLTQLGFGNPSPIGAAFPKDKIINIKWDVGIPATDPTAPWELWVDDLTLY